MRGEPYRPFRDWGRGAGIFSSALRWQDLILLGPSGNSQAENQRTSGRRLDTQDPVPVDSDTSSGADSVEPAVAAQVSAPGTSS